MSLTNRLSGITSIAAAFEFLVLMLYWQAVCGGMEFTGICDISTEDMSKIRATWQFIGQIRDLLAFGSNAQAACVIGQDDDLQLIAGDRTQQDLDAIAANLLCYRHRVGKSVNYYQNRYNFL